MEEQDELISELVSGSADPYQGEGPSLEVCQLPPSPGPCTTLSIPRWYYHPPDRQCKQFTFGGCQGNANNFPSLGECQAACSLCSQPPDAGPCRGQLERFYFSPASQQCLAFSYSGCAGNLNNFLSQSSCEETCRPARDLTETVCLQASDPGPCSDFQER